MIALCSLAMGAAVDWIYTAAAINPQAIVGQAGEVIPYSVQLVSAMVLTGLILYNTISRVRHKRDSHTHAHSHSH